MGFIENRKKRKEENQRQLKLIRSNKLDSKVFFEYLEAWQEWSESGEAPKIADNDLRYSLDLQRDRLRKHGISQKIVIDDLDDGPIDLSKVDSPISHLKDMHCISGRISTSYTRIDTGEVIGMRQKHVDLYETIVKAPEDHEGVAGKSYSCPNCGSVSKVADLLDGCPYCNTKFKMSELYPKVHNAYAIRDLPAKNIKKDILKNAVPVGIIAAIYFAISNFAQLKSGDMSLANFIFTLLFSSAVIGAILGYMIWAIRTLGTVFFEAGKSMPILFGSLGGKKKINEILSDMSSKLGYEYFEGKALSLLRCILFSDNPNDFVQYSGGPLPEEYKNIVDIQYRGGTGVTDTRYIEEDGQEKVQVRIRVFLENAWFDGNKIRLSNDTALMTLIHDRDANIDKKFTITAVNCPNCGGSFNATRQRNCVFCDTPFSPEIADWVVTKMEISRLK